jgi:hypothetical protein
MKKELSVFFTPHPHSANPILAIERLDCGMSQSLRRDTHREYTDLGCRISHAVLDGTHSYHTLVTEQLWLAGKEERERTADALRNIIRIYLGKAGFCLHSGRLLFCGLGNAHLSADALGPMTADRLIPAGRDPLYRSAGFTEMYVLKPGVPSQSGMSTGEHIRSVAAHLGADLILTADASAARTAKRLAAVVQVTDRGVWAGSGCGGQSDEISAQTMPCPVISITVPTVIRAALFSEDGQGGEEDFLVTRSETDRIAECYAELISRALNKIFSAPLCE